MNKRLVKSDGFGLLPAFLLFVILILVGFIGWHVWQNNNDDEQTNTDSAVQKTAQKSPAIYLTIKEWGVRTKLPTEYKDVYYEYLPATCNEDKCPDSIRLTSHSLDNNSSCEKDEFGYIHRWKEDTILPEEDGPPSGSVNELGGKRLSGFVYYYLSPQDLDVCITETDSEATKQFISESK